MLYVDFDGDGTPTLTEFGSQSSCAQAPPASGLVVSSFTPTSGYDSDDNRHRL